MPLEKLSKTVVDKKPHPEKGQVIYFDSILRGFGLRVTPIAKTYIAEGRVDGKTVRVTIGRHGLPWTFDEARQEAYIYIKQMSQGINPNAKPTDIKEEDTNKEEIEQITLQKVFEDFKLAKSLRPKTTATYTSAVMRRCFPDWLRLPITSITRDMVEERNTEIANYNGRRGKGDAQAHQAMRTLRSHLNYAKIKYKGSDGKPVLTANPVDILKEAKTWTKQKRRHSKIATKQLQPWMAAVQNLSSSTVKDYLTLLLLTGLRRTEAASLLWTDLNFDLATLKISGEITKNHHDHELPLSDYLIELFRRRKQDLPSLEDGTPVSPFVFPGGGKSGFINEPKRQINNVISASGVQFSCHDLRRTFITVADSLDISAYAIKLMANHKDSSDITASYVVYDVERLRLPMQRITDYFLQQCDLNTPQKPRLRLVKNEDLVSSLANL